MCPLPGFEFPESYSKFPWAIYFTYDNVSSHVGLSIYPTLSSQTPTAPPPPPPCPLVCSLCLCLHKAGHLKSKHSYPKWQAVIILGDSAKKESFPGFLCMCEPCRCIFLQVDRLLVSWQSISSRGEARSADLGNEMLPSWRCSPCYILVLGLGSRIPSCSALHLSPSQVWEGLLLWVCEAQRPCKADPCAPFKSVVV